MRTTRDELMAILRTAWKMFSRICINFAIHVKMININITQKHFHSRAFNFAIFYNHEEREIKIECE